MAWWMYIVAAMCLAPMNSDYSTNIYVMYMSFDITQV